MTLIQKLNDSIITNINIVESENRMHYEYNHLELAEKCEQIADDFAIGFAEWKANLEYSFSDKYTTKELLEIFKKQNGL